VLRRHTDGALYAELCHTVSSSPQGGVYALVYLLVLRTVDELLAHLLERLDIARSEGDADLVDLGAIAEVLLWFV
jgi:hypothetical protein